MIQRNANGRAGSGRYVGSMKFSIAGTASVIVTRSSRNTSQIRAASKWCSITIAAPR